MLSVSALPSAIQSPPALAVISHGQSSDTTLGSIPSQIVYSAVAIPGPENQRESQAAIRNITAASALPTAISTATSLANLSNPGSAPNQSVAFFAQLLSQSNTDVQNSITGSFVGAVPLQPGNPQALQLFTNIKYMPSGAGKPSAENPMPLPITPEAKPASSAPLPSLSPQMPKTLPETATVVILNRGVNYAPVTLPPLRHKALPEQRVDDDSY